MSNSQIDRERIPLPEIHVDDEAQAQLKMMWEFDPTLEGQIFRFSIDGKGCDGFDYACGFDQPHDGDFRVEVPGLPGHYFAFDPFAARYMPYVQLGFMRDLVAGTEGFTVTNLAQAEYRGKFWRKDPSKTIPLKDQQ